MQGTENYIEIESPGGNITKGVNLTGVRRKIKDNCADLHNLIQSWNRLVIEGTNILKDITDKRLKYTNEGDDEIYSGQILADVTKADPSSSLATEVSELCNKLHITVTQMAAVIEKMHKICEQFENCHNLDLSQRGTFHVESPKESTASTSNIMLEPLFQTWPTERFAEEAWSIYKMYHKDFEVKRNILEEVAFLPNYDQVAFFTAAWLHQPYIDENKANFMMESMLLETGHR